MPLTLRRLYEQTNDFDAIEEKERIEEEKRQEQKAEEERRSQAQKQRAELIKQLSSTDGAAKELFKKFVEESDGIDRFIELYKLWTDYGLDTIEDESMKSITEELKKNAYMERMYGVMDINLRNYKTNLKSLI